MDKPPPTQWIGYLLDALEENERAELEQALRERADWRQELAAFRRRLSCLELARPDVSPPPGLAARTCKFIFDAVREGVVPAVESIARPRCGRGRNGVFRFTPVGDYWSGGGPSWSWLDLAVATCVIAGFFCLLFPALVDQRVRSQAAQCRENLRLAHRGISDYGMRLAGVSPLPSLLPEEVSNSHGNWSGMTNRSNAVAVPRVMCCPTVLAAFWRQSLDRPTWRTATFMPHAEGLASPRGVAGWPVYQAAFSVRGDSASEYAVLLRDPDLALSPCKAIPAHVRGGNVLFEDGHVVFLRPRPEVSETADFTVRAAALVDSPR
ncbi:MAG: hypothetical protein ACUVQK_07725 [Thermogutta sp.]